MIKKYYYIMIVPIFLLFFSNTAKAYSVSQVSGSFTVTDGNSITVYTQSISGMIGETLTTESNETGDTYVEFTPILSVHLNGVNQQYLNGYIIITINLNFSSAATSWSCYGATFNRATTDDGLRCYMGMASGTQIRLYLDFDNYYIAGSNVDLGQIELNYQAIFGDVTPLTANLTTTVSPGTSYVSKTYFQNDRDTAILWNAIDQATGQNFRDVITLLTNIKNQDTSYYSQLVAQLSNCNGFLSTLVNYTNTINTNVSNINTNIGTILTDIESYIDFMEDYIPYLSNISTNTLNTYNQLLTIYNYMSNRPVKLKPIINGRIHPVANQNYTLKMEVNATYVQHVVLTKDDNIEYFFMDFGTSNVGTRAACVIYYENYIEGDNGQTNIYTRIVNYEKGGEQYFPIDFKYNENYAVINLIANETKNAKFKAYIGDGYTASLLEYYIQMMEKMNPQQSAEAAEIESQYNEKENQSESLAAGLGSLYMPSISSNDLDILSRVDTNQKNNFFGMLSIITNNSYITTLLLIIVTGAIVGFILYGKKS